MIKSISISTPNTYLLDIAFRLLFIMAAKKYTSDRKRSRPVTKRGKTDVLKKNKLVTGFVLIIIVAVAIAGVYIVYTSNNENGKESGDQNNGSNRQGNEEGNPIAVFNTTLGTFKVELFQDKMPETCENFIKLVNDGFYNGMNFYRISDNFMIQAGRYFPDGSEKQSPYGNINFEESDAKHLDGAISMASTGDKIGGSAEFFICDDKQTGLDGRYAAFGITIEGLDIVHNIASQPHDNSHPAGGGKPYTDIIINTITIENE